MEFDHKFYFKKVNKTKQNKIINNPGIPKEQICKLKQKNRDYICLKEI